jgi:hypothetical protein
MHNPDTSLPTILKSVGSSLDYWWDWSDWLEEGDSIASAEVDVPPPLAAVDSPVIASGKVTQQIFGGNAGSLYRVTCRVTTANGLVDERSLQLEVVQR